MTLCWHKNSIPIVDPTPCSLDISISTYSLIILTMSWLGKIAKVIIYFSFLFVSGLTIQRWSVRKYYMTKCHRVTGLWVIVRWCHITKSHGNCGKIVHRPCSSCISSIGNLTEALSSSPCQLRLGVVLRHLSLSPYTLKTYSRTIIN